MIRAIMKLKLSFIIGAFSLYWALANPISHTAASTLCGSFTPKGPVPPPPSALKQVEAGRLRSSPEKSGSNAQQFWNSLGARGWCPPVLIP